MMTSLDRLGAIHDAVRRVHEGHRVLRIVRPKGRKHSYIAQPITEPVPKGHVAVLTVMRKP